MHEFSVASYLNEAVDQQARQHNARRVLQINLVYTTHWSLVEQIKLCYCDHTRRARY